MFVVNEAEAAAIRAAYERVASCRPLWSCAGCSLASLTTRTPGDAPGPSRDGSRYPRSLWIRTGPVGGEPLPRLDRG